MASDEKYVWLITERDHEGYPKEPLFPRISELYDGRAEWPSYIQYTCKSSLLPQSRIHIIDYTH